KSGVTGYTDQDESIFVLNFSLNDSVAESAATTGWFLRCIVPGSSARVKWSFIGGRWNLGPGLGWRIEGGISHGQRTKDFALAENVERLFSDSFESGTHDDESNVAVFGTRCWIGGQWSRKDRPQEFIAAVNFEK